MTRTRDFKSFNLAKRFAGLMRFHGVQVRLIERCGLLRGTWTVMWEDPQ